MRQFTPALIALALTACPGPTPTGELKLTDDSLGDTTVGAQVSKTVAAEGGTAPLKFSATDLPAGLTLAEGGTLSGSATAAGDFTPTVKVTDASMKSVEKKLALKVFDAPSISTASLPAGSPNTAYSATVAATGGKAPLVLALTSTNLPAGLTFDAASGNLTGTPTADANAMLAFKVTDANGVSGTKTLRLTIGAPLVISTTSPLPPGNVGVAYPQVTLAATGGAAPFTWALTQGMLPAGMALSPQGVLSGTPSTAGDSSFTVSATDANQTAATKAFTLKILTGQPVRITTLTLPNAVMGDAYNQTLAAADGTPAYTWSVSSGTLPAGLTLASTGAISGAASATGSNEFTIQVTDANGQTATRAFTVTVNTKLNLVGIALPAAYVGDAYSYTLTATGGLTPYTFAIGAGTLPAGISMSSAGIFVGTPSATTNASVSITVSDGSGQMASAAFTLRVVAQPAVTKTTLLDGSLNTAYSDVLTASGGVTPYTFSIASGTLPAGITLTGATLAGTPTAQGTSTFTVQVSDANAKTATQQLMLTVFAGLTVTSPATLPDAYTGTAFAYTMSAAGGRTPYSWSVTGGALPNGLTLASNGSLSGTGTSAGNSSFTVQVQDANLQTATKSISLSMLRPPSISGTPGDAYVSVAYTASLTATDGDPPFTWAVTSGTLPVGITLNTSNGSLSGTPTAAGASTFTVSATDSNSVVATRVVSLTTYAKPVPTGSPADGYVGVAYSHTLTATGGKAPLTFAVTTGTLPNGLTLNGSSGGISGSPTAQGNASLTITVTDANGQMGTQNTSLNIYPLPAVTTTSLADGYLTIAYNQTLAASGGKAPLTWSITTGSLPAGLALDGQSGALTGTPTSAGAPSFTVTVTDANGRTGTRGLSITVQPALNIATPALPDAVTNAPYAATLTGAGGRSPYTFAVFSGTLPAGVTLASGGALSGTPTGTGLSTVVFQVTDANNSTATKQLTINVSNALTLVTLTLPDAYQSSTYSGSVVAQGGTTPYTFSVTSGTPPTGITLSSSGALSGTVAAGATSQTFTVQVRDATNATATRTLTIDVYPALVVTTVSVPDGYVGTAYSNTLAATGGKAPLRWSFTGTLPAGVTLDTNNGTLSGSPTTPGLSSFTAIVTDANNVTAQKALSLTVYTPPSITTTALNDGYQTAAYNQTLVTAGGKAPLAFTVTVGALPAGVSLGMSTGAFTGTPTGSTGASTFTVQVADANGVLSTRPLSITIYALPVITTVSVPDGYTGSSYSQTLVTTGGKPALSFAVTSGALPGGITLDLSSGALSGTPTATGTASFTITLTDANGRTNAHAYTLGVYAAPIISTTGLPDAYLTAAYNFTLVTNGGKAPLGFAVTSGALPAGISLDTGTGALTGTSTSTSPASFTITVTDANNRTGVRSLSMSTYALPVVATTPPMPDGYVGDAYPYTFSATGGKAPLSFTVTSGTLPAGVNLDPATGVLSGTATAAATSPFTVTATDANSRTGSRAVSVTIYTLPTISNATVLTDGYAGQAYSVTMNVSGGKSPFSWTLASGSLPVGLSISAGGVIGATVGAAAGQNQASNFNLTVTDANSKTGNKAHSITTYVLPTVTFPSFATATEGVTYLSAPSTPYAVTGMNGKAPLTFTATALPGGLAMSTAGVISGYPSVGSANNYMVNVTVTDANSRTGAGVQALTVAAPQPTPGGATLNTPPSGSPITDAVTIFVVDFLAGGPIANVGVRLRKNGVEFAPVKEALTTATGKVFFSGLGLNGTTDTLDITCNGKNIGNTHQLKIDGSLVTIVANYDPLPGGALGRVGAFDTGVQKLIVTMGSQFVGNTPFQSGLWDLPLLNHVLRLDNSTTADWSEPMPAGMATAPPGRMHPAFAFSGNVSVMFGGRGENEFIEGELETETRLNDTWTYNGSTNAWTKMNPTTVPSRRWGASMTPSNVANTVLMFGGSTLLPDGTEPSSNETWRFNAGDWQQRAAAPAGFAGRHLHGAAYNSATGEMFVCGGLDSSGTALADCAAYTASTNVWNIKNPLPTARSEVAMAYSTSLWAFGGVNAGVYRNDLLNYQGASWVTVTMNGVASSPPARAGGILVYDQPNNQLILFGGVDALNDGLIDTWTFNLTTNTWTRRSAAGPNWVTLSGTISGASTSSNSNVNVRMSTANGAFRDVQAFTASGGVGTYSFGHVPAGSTVNVSVFNRDLTVGFPQRLWSYAETGPITVSSNTTQNITLPAGPLTKLQSTGTYTRPAGFPALLGSQSFAAALFGQPFSSRQGFAKYWQLNGRGVLDSGGMGNVQFDYFQPATGQTEDINLVASAHTSGHCKNQNRRASSISTGPTLGALSFFDAPSAQSPGVIECSPSGDGLTQPYEYTGYAGTTGVFIGDFNGDGLSDVFRWVPSQDAASVSLGNGGVGSDVFDTGLNSGSFNYAIADIDGDNKLDLVASNSATATLDIYTGTGSGDFNAPSSAAVPGGPTYLALGDLNGDGKPDLITSIASTNEVTTLLNNSLGGFGTPTNVGGCGGASTPTVVAIGRLNGDSFNDWAVLCQPTNQVQLYFGNGNGGSPSPVVYSTCANPTGLKVADLGGDTGADLVIACNGSNQVQVMIGQSMGLSFTTATYATGNNGAPNDVAVGNLDANPGLDLAVTNQNTNEVALLFNNGSGAFSGLVTYAEPANPNQVAIGDLNGDSVPDVVVGVPLGLFGAGGHILRLGRRPPPVVAEGPFAFTAPANTISVTVTRNANNTSADTTLTTPASAGAQTISFPLLSTLAPSRTSAPSGQIVTWDVTAAYRTGASGPADGTARRGSYYYKRQ